MKQTTRFAFSLVLIALLSTALSMTTGAPVLLIAAGLFALGVAKHFIAPGNVLQTGTLYSFTISDTTYAGEAASSFIVKAITGNETIQGGHVYVKDGIKYKYTIPRWDLDYETIIQDRQATPTTAGTQTVDGKLLTPADYMIYIEFNPRDFEAHWFATQLNPTLLDRRLPVNVESVVIQEVLKRHDRFVNKILWGGDTTLTTIYKYFDGFVKKATDATDTLDLAGSSILTTTLAANILAELARLYALIPAALKYDPDMKIFMNYDLYDAYQAAMIAATYKGPYYTDGMMNNNLTYRGLKVVRIADMPAYKILIAKGKADMDSNMWVGMNSVDDVTLQMEKLQANSELYFLKLNMKLDCQFGWNAEVVNYV